MSKQNKFEKLSNDELNNIISKAKKFLVKEISPNHLKRTESLTSVNEFKINPFLIKYKASFLCGEVTPISLAKALLYPRVLGTSIDTIFGSRMQKFCNTVLSSFASTTTGIDIEFIDKLDGYKKYCQIKSGPETINADDVDTIFNHFKNVLNLARTNHLRLSNQDLIVGVFYGSRNDLSSHYKKINEYYPVYVGQEFWYRLTGVEDFYLHITNAIGEASSQLDHSNFMKNTVEELAKDIENNSHLFKK